MSSFTDEESEDFDDDFGHNDFEEIEPDDQPKTFVTKPKHKAKELGALPKINIRKTKQNYLEDSLERGGGESLKFYNIRYQISTQLISDGYETLQAILYGRLLANKYLCGVIYDDEIEKELASLA